MGPGIRSPGEVVSRGVGPEGEWGLALSAPRGKRDACWIVLNTRALPVLDDGGQQLRASLSAIFGALDEMLYQLSVCGVYCQK